MMAIFSSARPVCLCHIVQDLGKSIIRLDVFVKGDFKLIAQVLCCTVFQHVQSIDHFFWIADHHGAKYPVPERKNISKIGIGPGAFKMMMELVHIRCDENQTKDSINPGG